MLGSPPCVILTDVMSCVKCLHLGLGEGGRGCWMLRFAVFGLQLSSAHLLQGPIWLMLLCLSCTIYEHIMRPVSPIGFWGAGLMRASNLYLCNRIINAILKQDLEAVSSARPSVELPRRPQGRGCTYWTAALHTGLLD